MKYNQLLLGTGQTVMSHDLCLSSFKPTLYTDKWFCLRQKPVTWSSSLYSYIFFLLFSLFLVSKIDRHIVQRLYLCANCHFAWVQNAYYGCAACIWNDCRLQTQWLVTVAGGYGMSLSLPHSLPGSTKPTILPRLHSLTPNPWLTTKFCLTQTNPLTSAFQIFLWSARGNLANGQRFDSGYH